MRVSLVPKEIIILSFYPNNPNEFGLSPDGEITRHS